MIAINMPRLQSRIEALARIGATPRGGVSRLAFSAADRAGRDQVCEWMHDAGLDICIDRIGNIFGLRPGCRPGAAPVMTGSHIDSVHDGGWLDGCLGVLAGLEIVDCLNERQLETDRPLVIAVFSNEEGVRFQPDMMGSLVHAGGYPLDDALASQDRDGVLLGDALEACGYAGTVEPGSIRPHCFIELHIEQGPVLEAEGIDIGAVGDLQGISWSEVRLSGQANHAGTTPMHLRRDSAIGAARIMTGVREIARYLAGDQIATCGELTLKPNLINVIAREAMLSVDLRNTDEAGLQIAEARLHELVDTVCSEEGLTGTIKRLARFEPVKFDDAMVALIETSCGTRGLSCRRMTSGAGHDAQMMAAICPSAMIFTPSIGGVSHNPAEATDPKHLEAGANILLDTILALTRT